MAFFLSYDFLEEYPYSFVEVFEIHHLRKIAKSKTIIKLLRIEPKHMAKNKGFQCESLYL